MKICILHRYPLSIVESTNPSFPIFLSKVLEAGHKVFLVTFRNGKKHPFKERVNIREINISFERRNYLEVYFKSLLFIIIAPLKVYFLNRKENFDLIYCDDSFPFYEILVKLLTRNKVLIRRGDLMCAYILDKFGIFVKLFAEIVFLIEKFTWKKVDGISVITERFKQHLLNAGIDEGKIYVIEDSLDFEKFRNSNAANTIKKRYNISDEFIVMFHGVLLSTKGLEVLIRAVPTVVNKYKNVKFFIIGTGEKYAKLKKLTNELKMENYIIFTGWVDYGNIHDYLNICDIGVAIRKNTLANNLIITTALLQYWASSKPVIVPKLAAMSDVVQENINGFLFEPENSKSLASKIIEAIEKKNSLKQMGKNGRDFAIKKHNVDIIAEKMCQFVNYFLMNKKPKQKK